MWNLILDPLLQVLNGVCYVMHHYSIDKPTKDELVELLSSSKFTAGTWEQFVCCLPNMTQDIITGIKERGSIEEDTMSAVAQHCLDNNPDITWKKVINALLDADEATVARNVLDEHSGIKILCSYDNYFFPYFRYKFQ